MNDTQQASILIVDDDQTFANVLAEAFSSRGHRAIAVHNSADACLIAAKDVFDKVILDLKIDQESGLALLPKLKELLPNADIVILTGYSSIATTVHAIKLGANNYLCKPADADEILAAFTGTSNDTIKTTNPQVPSVDRLQWEYIQKTLNDHDGNISATARSLGMHRRTLQRKLQKRPVKK